MLTGECLSLSVVMVIVQLLKHIETTGLKEEGILRIPGSVTRVKVCDCVLMVKGRSVVSMTIWAGL